MTTPRKNRPSPEATAVSDVLGSNLGEDVPSEFRSEELPPDTPVVTTAKHVKQKKDVPPEFAVKTQDRLWIVLEDNDDIPPGGQFIGVDGAAFKLIPGIEAWVPVGLTEVLDAAVKSVPVQDEVTRQITGWKDRLRFPYRIVRNKPAPAGWVKPK
jgi:hypothetical protein